MKRQVSHSGKPTSSWIRSISSDSDRSRSSSSVAPSPPSSELCALTGFAYRLGSIIRNNDQSIVSNNDVRREAKLLMSLSCSSPIHMDGERTADNNNNELTSITSSSSSSSISGRITPTHSVTSMSSSTSVESSRRDSFCFTCPSLSLDDTRKRNISSSTIATPGSMLSRTLKVDDKDALRLSSEAMARNVIESFQKAVEWRIRSWVDSLSSVLVIKERINIVTAGQELLYSNEALLVAALREIEGKLQVREATTAFKVMNKVSLIDDMGSPLKKQRVVEKEDRTGLEEGEYVYDVIHILEMQCSLNMSSPAGNVQIDLNVPGKIQGSFLSSEDYDSVDKLTDVTIDLNTEMLASMIEKSSRIAVRSSAEALLKGEHVDVDSCVEQAKTSANNILSKKQHQHAATPKPTITVASSTTTHQTRTPKHKASREANYVSGMVVVTPASRNSASSPSFYCESSDSDGVVNKPVRLQIPDNFPSPNASTKTDKNFGRKFLQPQASRAYHKTQQQTPGNLNFASRLPFKKYLPHQKKIIVTPLKTEAHQIIKRKKGPSLPVLVEVACAAIQSKKKN